MIQKIRVNLKECDGCDRAAQDSQDWTNGHDHEGSMAKGELKDLILNAVSIYKMLGTNDQLPGWTSIASPVPPIDARTYSVEIQTVTAFAALKYAAAGVAIKIYVALLDGRTPNPTSVAIINGRI